MNPKILIISKPFKQACIPNILWIMLLAAFSAGYFVGGIMEAIAIKNDATKNLHYTGER